MTWKYLACLSYDGAPPTPPPNLVAALQREGCTVRTSPRDILLFASGDLPIRRFADGRAVALGPLFDRQGACAPARLPTAFEPGEAEMVLRRYWGSYVVLAQGREAAGWVLRDPSGALGCYHVQAGGAHWFTSMPHVLVDSGVLRAAFDWPAIAASLTRHSARAAGTALRGIGEVLPGALITCSARGTRSVQVWDARAHASGEPPADAAAALRDALDMTFAAWGKCFQRPLVEVSGGLDSAIVAAGLARTTPGASLITFAAAPGDPDETAYARALADHLGLPLEIARPRIEDVDLSRSLSRDLPRPNARAFTQAMDRPSLMQGRAIGADAFASGGGGDDVFGYLRTILPAVDRLHAQGPGAMAATLRDIATMNHATFWEAWSLLARRALRGPPGPRKRDLRLLTHAVDDLSPIDDALDCGIPGRPGKTAQVEGVLTIHNYLEGHGRTEFAPILSPLLSQPVVECCLAIPTWQWCEGGRNRAVARQAFADRLPRSVLDRRSKGSFDGFCTALLEANRARVGEMLLEGRLAREGWLDRPAVMAALALPFPPIGTVARLLALVDVEAWLSSWTARGPQGR